VASYLFIFVDPPLFNARNQFTIRYDGYRMKKSLRGDLARLNYLFGVDREIPKLCSFSWRWSYALMFSSTTIKNELPLAVERSPTASQAEVRYKKLHATMLALQSPDSPYSEQNLHLRMWLSLYQRSSKPLVRKWARIQCNIEAGMFNLASRLLTEYPFETVPARLAEALNIPQEEKGQMELISRCNVGSLGIEAVDEHDAVERPSLLGEIIRNVCGMVEQRKNSTLVLTPVQQQEQDYRARCAHDKYLATMMLRSHVSATVGEASKVAVRFGHVFASGMSHTAMKKMRLAVKKGDMGTT